MKTVTSIIVTSLFAISLLAPASANTISEKTTEMISKQLTELQEAIKAQTTHAIDNTIKQITEQFSSTVLSSAEKAVATDTVVAKNVVVKTEAE